MRLPIVNKDDIEIGTKERDELGMEDIYRVSALWVLNTNGQHLLSQRALSKKKNPGKWGPAVAGTVEVGETYETNILKEIQEEIGITLTIDDLRKGPKILRRSPVDTYFVQWYLAVIDKDLSEFTYPEDEVMDLKWITEEELCIAVEQAEEVLPSVVEILDVLRPEMELLLEERGMQKF